MASATALVAIGYIVMLNAAFAEPSWLPSRGLQWFLSVAGIRRGLDHAERRDAVRKGAAQFAVDDSSASAC